MMAERVLCAPASQQIQLRYRVRMPSRPSGEPPPLLLFLHGGGERGGDLGLVERFGPLSPQAAAERDQFVLVAPQCPVGERWADIDDALIEVVQRCLAELPIDFRRVYLTGMSIGGYGVWRLATRMPGTFAAIAPLCGGGHPRHGFPQVVQALRDTPAYVVHGIDDKVIPVSESDLLVETLRAAGGRVVYRRQAGVGHDCWSQTYADPAIYRWLLGCRRPLA